MRTACIITYGCQMNVHDSEIAAGLLTKLGLRMVDDPESADAVFVNTCTVREHAKNKGVSRLRALSRLKRSRPGIFLAAMGCVASEERERLRRKLPFLDAVIPTDQITRIGKFLNETADDFGSFINADTPKLRNCAFKAWITIITGCNMDCTYCIVPRTRGRERSRPIDDILSEVKQLADGGYKEITFLGQTVNNYGADLPDPNADFLNLLIETDRIFPNGRVRFLSPHPAKISDNLIDAWADIPSLCEHLHLPVQSGSNRVLRRMKRFYRKEDIIRKVEALRRRVPQIAVTTDIIVGFPGETESDFQETLQLCETARFDDAFMYIYSPRQNTPATRLRDTLPYEIARERHSRLVQLQTRLTRAALNARMGKIEEVLVEAPASRQNAEVPMWFGKSRGYKDVIFPSEVNPIGEVIPVQVGQIKGKTLIGRIANAVPALT